MTTDAVDTAQQFAAELAHAERGESQGSALNLEKAVRKFKVVDQSRARKARWHNGVAVAALILASVFLGAIWWAAGAKADGAVDAWEWNYGTTACAFLDTPGNRNITGLAGVILGAEEMGLTPEQAGQAVASSVIDYCPRHIPLLRLFVQRFGAKQVA